MAAQPQPEQTNLSETSIVRVGENIAGRLKERLPNAKIDLIDGRLKATPIYKIKNYLLGAEKQSNDGRTVQEDEVTIGQDNVVKTANLLEQELQATNEILPLTNPVGDIFFPIVTSSVISATAKNDCARHVAAKSDDYAQYGFENIPRLSEKGIPGSIGQAIVWATARATASTIDEETTKEARQIDGEYVQSAQTQLTGQITEIESQLGVSREGLRVVDANQQELESKAISTKKELDDLNDKKQQLQRFPLTLAGRITQPEFDQALKDLNIMPFTVEKKGVLMFKKDVVTEVRSDLFSPIFSNLAEDQLRGNLEMQNALKAFGYDGNANGLMNLLNSTVTSVVKEQVSTLFSTPAEQARQLFYETKNILKIFPSAELRQNVEVQENAFNELIARNPQLAAVFATELFTRIYNLNHLTSGIRKTNFPESQAWPVTSYLLKNYTTEIDKNLERARSYQSTQDNEKQAQTAQSEGSVVVVEKRRIVRAQERNLIDKQTEQSGLTVEKNKRINLLKAEIIAKLLVDQRGNPLDVEKLAAYPWRLAEYVIDSKLFSDTVAAISFGMPRVMTGEPGSNARETVINNMGQMGVIRERSESLTQSEDMLKMLIDPFIPKDHPTRELALKLIGEMLRRYAADKRVLMMGGFNFKKEINQQNISYYWNLFRPVFTAMLEGGKVVDIAGQVPRLKLSEIDLSAGSQETHDTIRVKFKSSGQTATVYTALENALKQVVSDGDGYVASENALLRFDQSELCHPELLTVKDLMQQGQGDGMYKVVADKLRLLDTYTTRPLYVVEAKS